MTFFGSESLLAMASMCKAVVKCSADKSVVINSATNTGGANHLFLNPQKVLSTRTVDVDEHFGKGVSWLKL
ncbi:9342_t:CDS:2 [Paraglomus brasilianum]|uniref:9342_t:CDS:1 n=1 Tax=Paraglomus brasilianum TaxID=144538 RepID=A0A9N9GVM7_9GLOM|nr:9342_t:CDS:2 [Paraglomus brasilianum]